MKGITATVEGRDLVLRINLDQDFGPSSSGKTNFVGTTGGFVKLDSEPGVSFGLNVVRKGPKRAGASPESAKPAIETLSV